jgi:hypothetical protein
VGSGLSDTGFFSAMARLQLAWLALLRAPSIVDIVYYRYFIEEEVLASVSAAAPADRRVADVAKIESKD